TRGRECNAGGAGGAPPALKRIAVAARRMSCSAPGSESSTVAIVVWDLGQYKAMEWYPCREPSWPTHVSGTPVNVESREWVPSPAITVPSGSSRTDWVE